MLADDECLCHLPVTEKLQLIDWLWQDIDGTTESAAIADGVLVEAERRAAELMRFAARMFRPFRAGNTRGGGVPRPLAWAVT